MWLSVTNSNLGCLFWIYWDKIHFTQSCKQCFDLFFTDFCSPLSLRFQAPIDWYAPSHLTHLSHVVLWGYVHQQKALHPGVHTDQPKCSRCNNWAAPKISTAGLFGWIPSKTSAEKYSSCAARTLSKKSAEKHHWAEAQEWLWRYAKARRHWVKMDLASWYLAARPHGALNIVKPSWNGDVSNVIGHRKITPLAAIWTIHPRACFINSSPN